MSMTIATKTRYTPEDLLNMPDGKSYELVNGQLVERLRDILPACAAAQEAAPNGLEAPLTG